MLPLRGQNNVQGAANMGSMPNLVAGYQRVDDPEVRSRLEAEWGVPPPVEPGLTSQEMIHAAAEGEIRALWIQGEDVVQSDPNESRIREALEALDFVMLQDLFLNETAPCADLVLPAAGALEQDGPTPFHANACGLVRLFGTVVEHEPGDRAQGLVIDRLAVLGPRIDEDVDARLEPSHGVCGDRPKGPTAPRRAETWARSVEGSKTGWPVPPARSARSMPTSLHRSRSSAP